MTRILSYCMAALMALSLPALAQPSMSAEEFESYTTGKTLYFANNGRAYGVEEYLENRRVRWSFLDGKCREGVWYEEAGQICFVYEDFPEPQCWTFRRNPGGGLLARFEDDPAGTVLYEADQNDEPMMCLGPEVGV